MRWVKLVAWPAGDEASSGVATLSLCRRELNTERGERGSWLIAGVGRVRRQTGCIWEGEVGLGHGVQG